LLNEIRQQSLLFFGKEGKGAQPRDALGEESLIVSIVALSDGVMERSGNEGDVELGGSFDFDL